MGSPTGQWFRLSSTTKMQAFKAEGGKATLMVLVLIEEERSIPTGTGRIMAAGKAELPGRR
jgi:hypothetical protein